MDRALLAAERQASRWDTHRTVVQGEGGPQLLVPPYAVFAALGLQVPRAPAAICKQQRMVHQTTFL